MWSPNGKYVAFISEYENINIFDVECGEVTQTLTKKSGHIDSIAWSPDSRFIFSNIWCFGTIEIWDITKKKFVKYLGAHGEDIFSAAWSPNGKYIVTGSADKTIKTDGTRKTKL